MSPLSSAVIRANIQNALIKPGGYKLKARLFADTTLKLEGEAAAASALYQRSEAAKDEMVALLSLLDPVIEEFLKEFTDGKSRYVAGGLDEATGVELQDAILTTLSAVGVCLQLGLMERQAINLLDDHLRATSEGMAKMEEDTRTHFAPLASTTLMDTIQSGALTADLLGLGDGESDSFPLPKRPGAERAKLRTVFDDLLEKEDPYTPVPTRTKKGKGRETGYQILPVGDEGSQALVVRTSDPAVLPSVASYFS